MEHVAIPDTIEELSDRCFEGCRIKRVTFGESSCLKRTGYGLFANARLEETQIPGRLRGLFGKVISSEPGVLTTG